MKSSIPYPHRVALQRGGAENEAIKIGRTTATATNRVSQTRKEREREERKWGPLKPSFGELNRDTRWRWRNVNDKVSNEQPHLLGMKIL